MEPLTSIPVSMYSMSFALSRMAEDVVNRRLLQISFTAQDIETGLTINGATVTLRGVGNITTPDSLLKSFIISDTLRALSVQNTKPYVIEEESKTVTPEGSVKFNVINFSEYTITFEHPQYHSATENLYIEKPLRKIFLVNQKGKNVKYDFIDQ